MKMLIRGSLIFAALSITASAVSSATASKKIDSVVVYGFSQGSSDAEVDSQVLILNPDINIRTWSKWDIYGTKPSDYNSAHIQAYAQNGILLTGGLTASVIFYSECKDSAEFLDMVSRDVDNNPVPHSYIVPDAYRGNIASPRFRNYIIKLAKLQIDAGVEGIFFDEVNAGYSGNKFNGNEGFDDYHLKDFNRFLAEKHPDFTFEDWRRTYKMDSANFLDKSKPLDDLENNFNYRDYLQSQGWSKNQFTAGNPLARVWGRITSNRPEPERESFCEIYTVDHYWKEIVDTVREYARNTCGKEILITSNGIFPYVDYNSVGLYNYNVDDNGSEAPYVPVTSENKLDGSITLKTIFRSLYQRNTEIAGNVPCVLFIDWPTEMMNSYFGFSPAQKMDYWKIYAAEAYAHGLYFSFHLKTSIAGDPTASESGVLDSLARYAAFYRNHRDLYIKSVLTDMIPHTATKNVTLSMTSQNEKKQLLVHIVNHNYTSEIQAQQSVTVMVPAGLNLKRVVAYFEGYSNAARFDFRIFLSADPSGLFIFE